MIKDLFQFCGPLASEIIGNPEQVVQNFGTPSATAENSLAFISSPKHLEVLEKSSVVAAIAPVKMKDLIENQSKKSFILSPNPELAAREIKREFVLNTPYRSSWQGVHPNAVVDPTAEISMDVTIGPNAIVSEGVKIGSGSFVGPNAVIEKNVEIGKNTTIHPLTYIGHSCIVGDDCEIMPQAAVGTEGFGYTHDHLGNHYRTPHSGRVILENDVHVGAGTAIDRGTLEDSVIKQGTKLDNQVHLAHNSVVGKNCLITAQVVMAGSSTIGDNFVCGGKTGITGHIKITDNVNVAGFSGITNDVREPGQYGGYPLVPVKRHLKVKASSVHLPEMRKQLNRILRKLFPEDYNK